MSTNRIEYDRAWRKKNAVHLQRYRKNFRKKNRKRLAEFDRRRNQIRQYDPQIRAKTRYRSMLHQFLHGLTKTYSQYCGCTLDFFKAWLSSQFTPGMTWANRGVNGWHVEHIKPLVYFDMTDPEQAKKALHYTNTRPLWGRDNRRKGPHRYTTGVV